VAFNTITVKERFNYIQNNACKMSQLFELFDIAGKTKYVRKSHCISKIQNIIFPPIFFLCVGQREVHILHQCASYREIAKKNIPIINYTYSLSLLCQVQKM
jgi:hypothetical protein